MPIRKLPVIAAFKHAARSVGNNLPFAIHISGPVYALLVPLILAGNILVYVIAGSDPRASVGTITIVFVFMTLATLLAFAIIAVRWHRYILRDDVPQRRSPLSPGPEVWRYAGNILLLVLLAIACVFIVAIVLALISGGREVLTPSMLAITALAAAFIGLVIFRLSVKFPAIALGRMDFGFADAWRATSGNNWEFLGFTLLNSGVVLAASLAIGGLSTVVALLSPTLGFGVEIVLELLVNWILTLFSCSVLTSLYGYFVEGRDF